MRDLFRLTPRMDLVSIIRTINDNYDTLSSHASQLAREKKALELRLARIEKELDLKTESED